MPTKEMTVKELLETTKNPIHKAAVSGMLMSQKVSVDTDQLDVEDPPEITKAPVVGMPTDEPGDDNE